MSQLSLPLTTDFTFPENDTALIVNEIVEGISEDRFTRYQNRRGASSYNPRMMLKIILYAYSNSIFSGRKIEFALKDSIRFMWLAQEQTPSYKTINRFRSNPKTNELIKECFTEFRDFLVTNNYIDEDAVYIDGTKIEADANKYTFVWKANTERYSKANMKKSKEVYDELMVNEILPSLKEELSEELQVHELQAIEDCLIQKIDASKDTGKRKIIRSKRTLLKKYKKVVSECKEKNVKYEEQKRILGSRNSYSKTDHDAAFMRMKDDHMRNGQLKAAYNIQVGTNNQFALAFGVYQNPTDTRTLERFLYRIQEINGDLPENIVCDAGYGSESNYGIIIDVFNRTPLMPYGMFLKEQKRKYKQNTYNSLNWEYDEKDDRYICSDDKLLFFSGYRFRNDKYGYQRQFKEYKCYDCVGCPLRDECMNPKTKSDTLKTIRRNMVWEYYKQFTREKLSDPKTSSIYKKRKIDVETFFGNLKANLGFTRMSVRGIQKVETEVGIACMAVNIRKLAALRAENFLDKIKKERFSFLYVKIVLFIRFQNNYVPAP
ncbi:IS1182 family transposase [Staphylococcus simulans]|uniref:IS1182 family transposase n=1 Tax=Staphylococcus simulans TaxID=1286 RepID=UPI000D032C70|nr:IS1182 family transposase [Staphylococcus simulans]